jgi:hypothetical protein
MMEIIKITPDTQGTRIHGIGGMIRFNEDWMVKKPQESKNNSKNSNQINK